MHYLARTNILNDTLDFDHQTALVKFKTPVTGATCRTTVLKILRNAMPEFDASSLDFDFVFGQEVRPESAKVPAEPIAGEERGGGEQERSAAAASSVGSDIAPAGVDSRKSSPVDLHVRLRFKAMRLMYQASSNDVVTWMPHTKFQHDQGCFGSVTFAFHEGLQRDVAIKTSQDAGTSLSPGMEGEHATVKFLEELEALALAAGHECIVRLLDVIWHTKGIGLVLERLGPSLECLLETGTAEEPDFWLKEFAAFQRAFAGLWSALAFLAERSLAHSDIKPGNICESYAGEKKLILCDFGCATFREAGCYYSWSRGQIERPEAVAVGALPYRAPELLFGFANYTTAIDVWSLGVIMAEMVSSHYLFRHLRSEDYLRRFLREHGDTRGDLRTLKSCIWGAEQDWHAHPGDLVSDKALEQLGGHGGKLLQGVLQLDPVWRIAPSAVLELPFFTRRMEKVVWHDNVEPAVSAAGDETAVSAAPEGPDKTVLRGARGECQVALGHLSPDLLMELRKDPYWNADHGWSWATKRGHPELREAKRMMLEKAAERRVRARDKQKAPAVRRSAGETKEQAEAALMCKMQISGNCGKVLRGTWNDMVLKKPVPAMCAVFFMEAFKAANEPIWKFLDQHILNGPMNNWSNEDLGDNGQELLKVRSRDWFGATGTVQVTKLSEHKEEQHFDPGTAILIMIVTLWGERKVSFFPVDDGSSALKPEYIKMRPGMVYLTSACGISHQVSYDGKSTSGKNLPDLGDNIGLSLAFRTSLFRRSPYPNVPPGPLPVYKEFRRVLRLMHSKFCFKLPSLAEYTAASSRMKVRLAVSAADQEEEDESD